MATKNIKQLTPNPAPALTDLIEVDDGAGSSFSETVQDIIKNVRPSVFTFHFTGTLPTSFPPVIQIDCTGGQADIMGLSGDTAITPFSGVCTQTPFVFSDPVGALTSLTFDNLAGIMGASGFSPTNLASVTSMSFPSLSFCGGNFSPQSMASLTTLSLPILAYVGGTFSPNTMAALTALSLPELAYVGGNFSPNTAPNLATLSVPNLVYVGTLQLFNLASLTSFSAPNLVYYAPNGLGSIAVSMASLTTFSTPATRIISGSGSFTMNDRLGNLTTVTLGTVGVLKVVSVGTINISGQKLAQASVNGILALLVSLDGTNGTTLWGAGKTVNISGGTSAAPSGQGIIDKATLVARSATVTTN
jgi:hypothetical protein